jgi:tetratricopeptide (TPR) repeat protein
VGALLVVLIGCVAGVVWVLTPPGPQSAAASAEGPKVRRDDASQQTLEAARKLINQGEFAKATALLDKTIEVFKGDQELRLAAAQALMGQEKWGEAYQRMREAIAIGPALPQIHFDAGTLANKAGLLDKAVEHYSLAQKADPADPRYPLYLAMVQIKQGQETQATASLLRVVKLDESIAEAWGTLGDLQLKADRPGVALPQYQRARTLQPRAVRWRVGEARCMLKQGDAAGAAGLLAPLEGTDAVDSMVVATLAGALDQLGRSADAAGVYERAAKARLGDAGVQLDAARALAKAGRKDDARAFAQRAMDLGHAEAEGVLAGLK